MEEVGVGDSGGVRENDGCGAVTVLVRVPNFSSPLSSVDCSLCFLNNSSLFFQAS